MSERNTLPGSAGAPTLSLGNQRLSGLPAAAMLLALLAFFILATALQPVLGQRIVTEIRHTVNALQNALARQAAAALNTFIAEHQRVLAGILRSRPSGKTAEEWQISPTGRTATFENIWIISGETGQILARTPPDAPVPQGMMKFARDAAQELAQKPGIGCLVRPADTADTFWMCTGCVQDGKRVLAVGVFPRNALERVMISTPEEERFALVILDHTGGPVFSTGGVPLSDRSKKYARPPAWSVPVHGTDWNVALYDQRSAVLSGLVWGMWGTALAALILTIYAVASMFWIVRRHQRMASLLVEANQNLARYGERLEEMVAEQTADIRRAKEQAEEANRIKSEFLANMSHEIRTPLNAVLGFADLLLEEEMDEGHKEYIRIIHDNAKALLELVSSILDFSRIERGEMEVEVRPFSPRKMIDDMYNLFQLPAEQKKLKLHVDPGNLPDEAFGDSVRLRQILSNLISNAIKFTPENGRVIVRGRTLDTTDENGRQLLQFEVSDTGIGIPEEQIERIFEPFHQVDGSMTRMFGGTGLGLAIVRRLVEHLGGSIEVESTVNQGSTFRVTLPVERPNSPPSSPD